MKILRRCAFALFVFLVGAGGAVQASTEAWPTHALRIVVPYAPGGATDAIARLIGQQMGEYLQQPVIVENKAGASSNIGMAYVADAPPDGYTLLLVANSLVTNNSLFASLPFDGLRDFTPIGEIASAPLVVTVPVDSKIDSFGELIETARKNPGSLTYASAGNGSSSHLAGESLKQAANIDVLHVPYKGAAPAIADLLGGRISFMTMNTVEIAPYVAGKRVKMLAVAAPKRLSQAPDLPTVTEAGLPNYNESVWFGLAAPAGTPPDIVARLHSVLQKAITEPTMTKRLTDMGANPTPGSAQEFADFLQKERARIATVVSTAHIKPN